MAAPNFVNRTLWTGDNLDILRGLNSESIDLIYLDPPFNSNQDYAAPVGSKAAGAAFKDAWTLSDLDVAWMGLIADEKPALAHTLNAAGHSHGKGMQSYLTMMAVRLLEMRRVLKDTGSIYLHCDPTASHYLKQLMDSIFGAGNFRNEVTWRRVAAHGSAKRWAPIHDVLFYYSKSDYYQWNSVYEGYDEAYVNSHYRYSDEHGRFRDNGLTGPGTRDGESGQSWRGIDPTSKGRHWAVPTMKSIPSHFELPPNYAQMTVQERLDVLDGANLIYWPPRGETPSFKRYLEMGEGIPIRDVIWDISPINSQAKERIGYPTQKPVALLERIIHASSNPGDVVLDPFCGCATACVAAEKLGREWLGIDLSPKAVELVNVRLQEFMGSLFHNRLVTARTDIPRRTDIDAPINYRKNKHVLFGQQEGRCAGCRMDFPFKIFEVDHVIPQARGGTDHLDNLQLLCPHCNRIKGDRPQEYLLSQLSAVAAV